MEQQNFALSNYASISATVDYVTTSTHVSLVKQVYEKGHTEAKLKSSEYEEFKRVLPELVNAAQAMFTKIEKQQQQQQQQQREQLDGRETNEAAVAVMGGLETASENPHAASNGMVDLPIELWQVVKKLSPRYIAKLSIYKSPEDKAYVTMGVRQFFIDAKGVIRFKRNQGISLTFKEIMVLTSAVADVETFFQEKLSTTKVFDLAKGQDVRVVHEYVDQYWRFGGPKCRIVLRKVEEAAAPAVGAVAAAAAPSGKDKEVDEGIEIEATQMM